MLTKLWVVFLELKLVFAFFLIGRVKISCTCGGYETDEFATASFCHERFSNKDASSKCESRKKVKNRKAVYRSKVLFGNRKVSDREVTWLGLRMTLGELRPSIRLDSYLIC